jgi:hypothetical protein
MGPYAIGTRASQLSCGLTSCCAQYIERAVCHNQSLPANKNLACGQYHSPQRPLAYDARRRVSKSDHRRFVHPTLGTCRDGRWRPEVRGPIGNLLAKVFAKLLAGGCLIIHDFIMNERKDDPLISALDNVMDLHGRPYSASDHRELLQEAGVY